MDGLEEEGKHVYMLQDWERIKSAYAITGRSEGLYTAKEIKAEKERISKAKSEASKQAWARRKAMDAAAANMEPEEQVRQRKELAAQAATLKEIGELAAAGYINRAKELVGTLPREHQKAALDKITTIWEGKP